MKTPTAAATLAFQPERIISVSPIIFSVDGRQVDLQVKVSAPLTGEKLPVIVLSHGHGISNFLASMRGYAPLANYFAAKGFVVIQPTHENAKALAIDVAGSDRELFWKSRTVDIRFIIGHLEEIECAVPGLAGRVDRERVALVGHSMGGHTTAMLAGMSVTDADGTVVRVEEPRLGAFVMFGAPGQGDLSEFALEHYPMLKGTDFSTMVRNVLVVNGDKDKNPRFSEREQWRADAYHKSPSPKCLLTVFGAEHIFGGISGYDAAETTDDSPERVLFVANATVAYLRTALNPGDASWPKLREALGSDPAAPGAIESK